MGPTNTQSQWFSSIDVDRSGQLDARELQRALALGNLNFSLTDVRVVAAGYGWIRALLPSLPQQARLTNQHTFTGRSYVARF